MRLIPSTSSERCGSTRKQYQRGLSLIESLVALVVLALGIMGLAGVQTRLLAESRTANYRSTAISLIDDMTNRMLLNRDAAVANSYALAWGAAATAAQDCAAAVCTGAQLAQSDLNQWRATLAASLPAGNALIFQSATDTRQIGIAIAWAANEAQPNDGTYTAPFTQIAAANGVDCPTICHLVYVQP